MYVQFDCLLIQCDTILIYNNLYMIYGNTLYTVSFKCFIQFQFFILFVSLIVFCTTFGIKQCYAMT